MYLLPTLTYNLKRVTVNIIAYLPTTHASYNSVTTVMDHLSKFMLYYVMYMYLQIA